MLNIKLKKIKIRNFKGLKDFEFEPDGQDVQVFGTNGAGKTTLYDAFTWSLFGKNSKNEASFEWKPKDKDGNEINHLETGVETTLEVDGQEVVLERIIEEKWTKKRGSGSESFDGHVSTYKIDGLEKKKKEFDEYINGLIDEDTFKILTNLFYFPEIMKWEDRRKLLLEMSGDVTDEEVIAANPDLEQVKELLEDASADDAKERLKQQAKDVKKQLKGLPDRIDEVDRSMPDTSGLNEAKLSAQKKSNDAEIESLKSEISAIESGDRMKELENEIKQLEIDWQQAMIDHANQEKELNASHLEKSEKLKEERQAESLKLDDIEQRLNKAKRNWQTAQQIQEDAQKEVVELRDKWAEVKEDEFGEIEPHETTCPYCKQELPVDQINAVQAQFEAKRDEFNRSKVRKLEEVTEEGKKAAEKAESMKAEIEELEVEIEKIRAEKEASEKAFNKLNSDLTAISSEKVRLPDFRTTDKAVTIKAEVDEKEAEIEKLKAGTSTQKEEVLSGIEAIEEENDLIQQDLNKLQLAKLQQERLEELTELEINLNQELGSIEQKTILLEDFTRAKVDMLTGKINAEFEFVEFRLFEEQINGGLREICEPTVNGRSFSGALSNGERVKAGLDILNTLSKYYEAEVPVFIDNSEGVVDIQEIDTQVITLNVSKLKKHEKLAVEAV